VQGDTEPDNAPALQAALPSLSERIGDLAALVVVALVLGGVFVIVRAFVRRRRAGALGAGSASGPSASESALAALGATFLALTLRWPLPLHMTSRVPAEIQDPVLQAWHVAWAAHALLTQPLHPFQANVHWPLPNALAYTDGLIGFAPFGLLGQGAAAALAQYNGLYLAAYALAFLGAYLLAREVGAGPGGAAVAGAAYAYGPWRIAQENHMNILSSGGIPLTVFLLLHGYRRQRPGFVLAGWLVAAWQMSLGFALGLQFGYLLAGLTVVGLVVWSLKGRPRPHRAVVLATVLGGAVLLGGTALLARPYLAVVEQYPEARRSFDRVQELSPPNAWSYLAAPAESVVWGPPTASVRAPLNAPGEQTLFPGAVIVLLALIGAVAGRGPPALRVGLVVAVVALGTLALGAGLADGAYGYRWIYEHAPGWESVRTPGRLMTLITLGLALLAGLGAQRLVGALTARWPRAGSVLAPAVCALVILEGFNLVDLYRVPTPPPGQRGAPAPQLHAPSDLTFSQIYTFWSVDDGFPLLLNGGGSTPDTALDGLERPLARSFPDRETVASLRRAGVGSVVFHPDLARGLRWEGLERRPVRGLPIRRRSGGGVVVYELTRGAPARR